MSKSFLNEEWKNEYLQKVLKNLCAHDFDCVIIPIVIDNEAEEDTSDNIKKLEEYYDEEGSCMPCKKQIRHSLILEDIEPLNSNDNSFRNDLKFLMPLMKKSSTAKAVVTYSTALKNREISSPFSIAIESENGSISKNATRDDMRLLLPNTKPADEDLVMPFNSFTARDHKNSKQKEFLSSDESQNYFHVVSSTIAAQKSARENELRQSTARSTREYPESDEIPNYFDPVTRLSKKDNQLKVYLPQPIRVTANDIPEKRYGGNSSRSSTRQQPEMIPVNHNINFNTSSDVIIPVVSASSKPVTTTEISENEIRHKEERRRKKKKNKDKRSQSERRQANEDQVENTEFNIMPIKEDVNVVFVSLADNGPAVALASSVNVKRRNN